MSDSENYEKLLADAEEERSRVASELAGIDQMIAFLKKRLGRGEAPTVSVVPDYEVAQGIGFRKNPPEPERFPRLRPDAFFKMNTAEAIKEYLNIAKRPQSAKAITEALQQGGLTHKAKDLYQTVFPTLLRMKDRGQVEKLGNGDWGLAEWYRRGSQPQAEEEK